MSTLKVHVVPFWLRQFHRWVSIAFTATVMANFIVRALGTPPLWVTYSPLLPLALLVLTGLYLFTLPYMAPDVRFPRASLSVGRKAGF